MSNRPLLALAATAAASAALAAGCGSSSGSSSGSISGDDAKAAVEKAAAIRLAAQSVPGDARRQGLTAAYSNATTAAADKQFVFVFTVKDSGTLNRLKGQLKDSLSGVSNTAAVVTHDNVMVVYGAIGNDHLAAVKSAVNAL